MCGRELDIIVVSPGDVLNVLETLSSASPARQTSDPDAADEP